MKRFLSRLGCVLIGATMLPGCQSDDPAAKFIKMVDAMPSEERPHDWARTKALMSRTPPSVGQPAPDFTLKTMDGSNTLTLSEFHPDRPRVLIFGSYT